MSVLLREDYYTLKDFFGYMGSQYTPKRQFYIITLTDFKELMLFVLMGANYNIDNLTVLETVWSKYILPTYANNSCFKVTTNQIYSEPKTIPELIIEKNEAVYDFALRVKAWSTNAQELVDKLAKYNTLIANYGTGKKRETKTQMDNNDTPQDYSATPYSTGGYTNNIQVNKGEEQETPSNFDELEALKYIDDISFKIANLFRDLVLID